MASNQSGIQDWWLQRISAGIIAAYVLLLIVLLLVNGTPNAAQWQALFANNAFKAFTLLALIATFYHGLIGVLHIWPDYIKNAATRATLNALSWLAAAGYALYAVYILFGLK
ncbi:MAG: succinate dehydrogenase, hydrophobic membrane anchor protein [Betaproteobacteria bacterium]|nr:MAG: succinate dehydrogenase, hydrophobic membrane anchor protein [Betaproteobacteria bacterium]